MAGKKQDPKLNKTDLELIDDKSDVKGKSDGKARIQFKIQVNPKQTLEAVKEQETMQVGNKQATLQTLLNRGLHPKGEAVLEDAEITHEGLTTMEVLFTYAAHVVPASLDFNPEDVTLPVDREADKRERVRLSKLRAASDPAGFVDAE
ncbi:MAG TPA: hypothetical protein VJW23_14625 [Propionibacteriaceae bacterium]|nr:hypothetical protein [Propionibacteriaceae bacterium]